MTIKITVIASMLYFFLLDMEICLGKKDSILGDFFIF